ncbi:MAG: hypothetical protein LBD66_00105 [Holosporales bacterium]|nr:hypothetical protein [Holosporales bacterium]
MIKDLVWGIVNKALNVGTAEVLIVEISGVCNAICRYCCRGTGNHVSTCRFMSAEKFAAILAHLKKNWPSAPLERYYYPV